MYILQRRCGTEAKTGEVDNKSFFADFYHATTYTQKYVLSIVNCTTLHHRFSE